MVYGDGGLLANLAKGSIIAVSSTTSPAVVQEIDKAAKPKGIGVLDAPICRGRFAADAGTLLALVGGAPDVVERGRAVYGSFCSDYAHLGDVGHGQVGKTMNNLLLWISAVGLIEAGRLAETTGIDLVKLRDALLMSSGASDALKDWDMISFTWALEGHAGGGRDGRQGRALAAGHRRRQGAGQGIAPHQGDQSAELDRQGPDEIQLAMNANISDQSASPTQTKWSCLLGMQWASGSFVPYAHSAQRSTFSGSVNQQPRLLK